MVCFIFSPSQRQCYFSKEGNLDLFDYYTENNCKLDCIWKKATEVRILIKMEKSHSISSYTNQIQTFTVSPKESTSVLSITVGSRRINTVDRTRDLFIQ